MQQPTSTSKYSEFLEAKTVEYAKWWSIRGSAKRLSRRHVWGAICPSQREIFFIVWQLVPSYQYPLRERYGVLSLRSFRCAFVRNNAEAGRFRWLSLGKLPLA
jgi:hypothetical protein